MRLLIVTTMQVSEWGGSEELWYHTALAALAAGHTVGVLAFKWPKRSAQLQTLADRGVWLFERRRGRTGRLTTLHNRISNPFRGVEAFKPDVVYINQGGTYDLAGPSEGPRLRELIDRLGVPYAMACHLISDLEIPSTAHRAIVRQCFAKARWVGFVAAAMIKTAQRQLAAPVPNARVLRNPVNLQDFYAMAWPAGSAARFAFVGRLEPRKGLDLLLDCLAAPCWRDRDWSLDVYGDGPHRDYYPELISYLGLEDRVKIVGHQRDVREIWRDHHMLLLTSHYEGTPLAIVEALLLGRPVLTTNVGGSGEWVFDGQTGFLAEAPSTHSISAALDRAWDQHDRWQEIGVAARALAISQYDPDPGRTILNSLTSLLDPQTGAGQ